MKLKRGLLETGGAIFFPDLINLFLVLSDQQIEKKKKLVKLQHQPSTN